MATTLAHSRLPGGLSSESAPVLVFDPPEAKKVWLTRRIKITSGIKIAAQVIEFIMVP
jgi:hypothetical protein